MLKNNEDIAFEFIRMGRFVKVSAIDMVSGKEVSIVGDPKASEERLKRIVLAKLKKAQS